MPFFCASSHRVSVFSAGLVVGICLVFILSLPATAQASSTDPDDFIEGNYWALIIGISKYPTLGTDKQLSSARKDAEVVAKLLKERYGFSGKRMIELYDEAASRKGIIRACSSMKRRLMDKDSLFIYYAGQGEYENAGKARSEREKMEGMGYWIPADAEPDDPASYIFNSQMRDYAANIPAKHILMVVDSVFSGSLLGRTRGLSKGAIKELYQHRSRWIMASGGRYPPLDRIKNDYSKFAWDFMKWLASNKEPYLLAGDLFPSGACLLAAPKCTDARPLIGPIAQAGDEGGQFVFRLQKESQKGPVQKDAGGLERQPKEAEEVPGQQQEEIAKKKQELLDRIKKLDDAPKKPDVEATLRPFQLPKAKDPAQVVTIPAGEFIMGSEPDKGQADETPQRTVYLDAYTIDKYEVTVSQYREYLKKSGGEPPDFWERINQKEDMNRPVVGVDWLEATEYCGFYGKRLPTEAQWEKAARGTDGRKYPWGDEDPSAQFANFASGISFNYSQSLAPVGSYEAGKSPYGVYDMVGNVWEWVNDWYHKDYYQHASQKNPAGPNDGDYAVIRGGSWSKRPAMARVAGRMYLSPSTRSNSLGFRCAGEAQ